VEGVDVVFIGPTDLSGSLGMPGQTGAPEVNAAIEKAMTAARAAGKPLATVPRIGRTTNQLFDDGFLLVATGSEIYFYRLGITELIKEWRAYSGQRVASETGKSAYGR